MSIELDKESKRNEMSDMNSNTIPTDTKIVFRAL